jgi:hypothetical protein
MKEEDLDCQKKHPQYMCPRCDSCILCYWHEPECSNRRGGVQVKPSPMPDHLMFPNQA